jgi:hypothetical protein
LRHVHQLPFTQQPRTGSAGASPQERNLLTLISGANVIGQQLNAMNGLRAMFIVTKTCFPCDKNGCCCG